MMKKGIRILALEDSPFDRKEERALIVGVVWRDGIVEGILSFDVEIDGEDSADQIIRRIKTSRFSDQIKLIALHGITFAGLNFIDIPKIRSKLKLPVVSVLRKEPHRNKLVDAVKIAFPKSFKNKLSLLRSSSKGLKKIKYGNAYLQAAGISAQDAKQLYPDTFEALRLAHLIAHGIVKGESKGRI